MIAFNSNVTKQDQPLKYYAIAVVIWHMPDMNTNKNQSRSEDLVALYWLKFK